MPKRLVATWDHFRAKSKHVDDHGAGPSSVHYGFGNPCGYVGMGLVGMGRV